jgi:RNA polymerase sigma-70 factor (ECF subfamily)
MQNNAAETEALWRAFSKPLRAFVLRRVHEAQDADDILQEVFVRIHRSLGSLRQMDSLPAWLFQITRNAVADHYRSRRERGQPLDADFYAPAAANQDRDEQTGLSELSACLAPMIAALPEKYRDALVMTALNGLSQQEAANRLGVSLSGAKSRIQRGRRQIKDMLQACCRVELDRLGGVVDFAPRSNGGCRYCGDGSEGTCDEE